jgi:DNA-binding winged helix-turn-helix (wHTH) protein/TolB-like protein
MAAVNLPPLTFTFGPYRLDHETGQLHQGDRIVSLQPRPLAVLRALLEAGGSLVTKEDLIERVWDGAFIEDSNITKCIAEIRQSLRAGFRGADPVITVWKQGYRFVAPVQISAANPTPSIIDASAKAIRLVPPQPVPTESGPAPQPKFRVPRVAAILAAAGLVILAAQLVRLPKVMSKVVVPPPVSEVGPAPPASPERPSPAILSAALPSVALLGIRNGSAEQSMDWIAIVLMETLTGELQGVQNLRAVPRSRVSRVERDLNVDPTVALDAASMREVASQLNAEIAITGAYLAAGKNIQIDMRLADVQAGKVRASVGQTGTQDGLPGLISRTGAALRRELGIPDSSAASLAPQSISNDALHMYADGLQRLNHHDGHGAMILLCRARKLAPDYMPILRSLERIRRPGMPFRVDKGPQKPGEAAAPALCPPDDGRDLPPLQSTR